MVDELGILKIFRSDRDLKISILGVQGCECPGFSMLINTVVHPKEGIRVLDYHRITFSVVEKNLRSPYFCGWKRTI